MDSNKDIAEEQLLRVIEQGHARSASIALGTKKGNPFKGVRKWLAQNYARPIGRESDSTLRMLRTISSILWFLLACFGIYFIMDLVSHQGSKLQLRIFQSSSQTTAKPAEAGAAIDQTLKPESYYTDGIQNPNPFTGAGEEVKVVVEETHQGPTPAEQLAEMAKGLAVVGINRGANPDAIIEHTEQKRTYFVKAGDKINDMTVKEIKHDTVVLSYEGQDVEIS